VKYVYVVRTDRLEGDSSDADLKNSCSSLGHLGWENMQISWGDLLELVLWCNYADLDVFSEMA
jgi:hypothetical protein